MDVAECTCSSVDGYVGCFQCGANMKTLKEDLLFKPVHRHACPFLDDGMSQLHLVWAHLTIFVLMTGPHISQAGLKRAM